MIENLEISTITLSLYVPERARCDIQIRRSRGYYYFATADTREDGELPIPSTKFEKLASIINTNNTVSQKIIFNYSLEIEYKDGKKEKFDNENSPIDNILDIVEAIEHISDELLFLQWFY